MTAGSKFERNEFTGFEVQPTVRARWSARRHSLWGAVSRAVRVPTRFDTDLRFRLPGSTTGALLLTGNSEFESENVIAYEAGYRQQLRERISVDLAGYVNRYDDLRTQELRTGEPITAGQHDERADARPRVNRHGSTRQLVADPRVARLSLEGAHLRPGQQRSDERDLGGQRPANIFKVRSYINATNRIEIDAFFRAYGERPSPAVDAYQELDARIGYRLRPGWDLSLIGNDLLHDRHQEFRAGTAPETYERAVSVRSVWRF